MHSIVYKEIRPLEGTIKQGEGGGECWCREGIMLNAMGRVGFAKKVTFVQ